MRIHETINPPTYNYTSLSDDDLCTKMASSLHVWSTLTNAGATDHVENSNGIPVLTIFHMYTLSYQFLAAFCVIF